MYSISSAPSGSYEEERSREEKQEAERKEKQKISGDKAIEALKIRREKAALKKLPINVKNAISKTNQGLVKVSVKPKSLSNQPVKNLHSKSIFGKQVERSRSLLFSNIQLHPIPFSSLDGNQYIEYNNVVRYILPSIFNDITEENTLCTDEYVFPNEANVAISDYDFDHENTLIKTLFEQEIDYDEPLKTDLLDRFNNLIKQNIGDNIKKHNDKFKTQLAKQLIPRTPEYKNKEYEILLNIKQSLNCITSIKEKIYGIVKSYNYKNIIYIDLENLLYAVRNKVRTDFPNTSALDLNTYFISKDLIVNLILAIIEKYNLNEDNKTYIIFSSNNLWNNLQDPIARSYCTEKYAFITSKSSGNEIDDYNMVFLSIFLELYDIKLNIQNISRKQIATHNFCTSDRYGWLDHNNLSFNNMYYTYFIFNQNIEYISLKSTNFAEIFELKKNFAITLLNLDQNFYSSQKLFSFYASNLVIDNIYFTKDADMLQVGGTKKSLRKNTLKSVRKSVRKSLRKSLRKSVRKSLRKSVRKSLRKSEKKLTHKSSYKK